MNFGSEESQSGFALGPWPLRCAGLRGRESGDEKSGNKHSENFRRAEPGKVKELTGIVVRHSLSDLDAWRRKGKVEGRQNEEKIRWK